MLLIKFESTKISISFIFQATFWCDFIVLNMVEKRQVYREHILESVEEQAKKREREQSVCNEFVQL